ncbi:MAG: sugar phosphate nucleotidyltransferase [bacterium]
MKALIPAAGVGTRLRPHTYTVPKALLDVAGKPILGHIVDRLLEAGIDEICFVVGYKGEEIRRWAEEQYEIPMHFVEQTERLGLAHAVLQAEELIGEEPVFIILGDTLYEADLESVIERGANSLGVMEVEDPRRFGVVVAEGERVVRLVEKPDEPISHLAIAGLYHIADTRDLMEACRRLVEEDIRTRGEYQLTDALSLMLEGGSVFRVFSLQAWYDCGVPETVLATNRALLEKSGGKARRTEGDAIIVPPVHIGEGVVLEHAVVGPYVSLDDGVQIRESVVRNSIIGSRAEVRGAVLDGSLVGDNAVVRGRPMALNVGDSAEIDYNG